MSDCTAIVVFNLKQNRILKVYVHNVYATGHMSFDADTVGGQNRRLRHNQY